MTLFRTDRHNAAQQKRMVQMQVSPPDLKAPVHEWRRLFVEIWGAFLLVLVAAGGGVDAAQSGGAVTLGMIAIAALTFIKLMTFCLSKLKLIMINNYRIVNMNLFAYLDWLANAGLQNRVIQRAVVKKLHLEKQRKTVVCD